MHIKLENRKTLKWEENKDAEAEFYVGLIILLSFREGKLFFYALKISDWGQKLNG